MMKRLLLIVLIASAAGQINGQCVPNTSITQPGIYPDSATGLTQGVINQAYNQVMQIKVPVDTTTVIFGTTQTVTIDSISLLAFSNLPPGLTYACNPSSCIFPGGSNGCVLISGTPTQTGTFTIMAVTSTKGKIGGFLPVTQIDTINYYNIVITSTSSGIAGNQNLKFELFQNDPNPFSNYTDIKFTVGHQAIVTLKVFNLIGKEILHKTIQSQAGRNNYRLVDDDLSPGVYMFTLNDGITTYTRRMIYSKR
ncbi:MAG: T9SS type A sorting domain-containing protein [Bacteroidia bacterium]